MKGVGCPLHPKGRKKTADVSSDSTSWAPPPRTCSCVQTPVSGSMENSLAGDDVSHDHRPGSFTGPPHLRSESVRNKLSSFALVSGNRCICHTCCHTQDPDFGIRVGHPCHVGRLGLCLDEHCLTPVSLSTGEKKPGLRNRLWSILAQRSRQSFLRLAPALMHLYRFRTERRACIWESSAPGLRPLLR